MGRFVWHSEAAFIFQTPEKYNPTLVWFNLANRLRICRGGSSKGQGDCVSPTSLRKQEKMELPAGFGVSSAMTCILHISTSIWVGLELAARETSGSAILGRGWAPLPRSAPGRSCAPALATTAVLVPWGCPSACTGSVPRGPWQLQGHLGGRSSSAAPENLLVYSPNSSLGVRNGHLSVVNPYCAPKR